MAISSIAQPVSDGCLLVMDLLDVSQVCIISDLLGYICFALWGTSMGMLALISYDRYPHLLKLSNYLKYITTKKLKILIPIIFFYPNLFGSFIFIDDAVEVNYYLATCHVGVCGTILSFYYHKVWKIAITGMISTANSRMKKQWRMTKSMALILLAFIVC